MKRTVNERSEEKRYETFPKEPSKMKKIFSVIAILSLVFSPVTPAFAATASWTGGDPLNSDWTDGDNWSATPVPTLGDTATFNAAAGAGGAIIDLGGAGVTSISNIVFDTANAAAYTIGVAGVDDLTIDDGGDITVNASVANTQTIAADIIMNNSANFTNNATASTTLLNITGDVTSLGAVIAEFFTLDGSNTGDNTVSGDIDDGIAGIKVRKNGTGTWVLSGTNTYDGATTVNAGTLKLGSAGALGTVVGGTTVASGATLDLNGQTIVLAEALTLNGTGVGGGGALLNSAAGAASYAGAITLASASTITSTGAGGLTLSGGIDNGGFDLTFDGVSDTTVDTVKITGAGGIIKNCTGELSLDFANDYTGTTTINAGTVVLGDAAGLGGVAGGTVVAAGAALDLDGQTVGAEALTLNGTGVAGSGALYDSTGGAVYNGMITLGSASTITSTGAGNMLTLSGGITNAGFTTTFDGAGDTTVDTVAIAGTGGVTKNGAGTLTLGVSNTYTGTTTINAGTVDLTAADALADTGAVVLADVLGAELLLTAGDEQIGSLAGGGTTGGVVTLGANTLTVGDASSTTFSGVITGTGGLIKVGAGTLTLDNAGTNYTGNTAVNAGTLAIGADMTIGGNLTQLAASGAVLDLGTSTLTLGGAYDANGNPLNVTVNGSASGALVTGGAADLGGSTLNITIVGNVTGGTTYQIVTATGALTDVATIASSSPMITFTSDGAGGFTSGLAGTGFAGASTDGNTSSVGTVFNEIFESGTATGDMATVMSTLLGMGSSEEVSKAMETMMPDMSSGALNASRELTGQFMGSISNRLGYRRSGLSGVATGDMFQGTGFWIQGLGSHVKQDARKGIEGYQANVFGTSIGVDQLIDRNWRAGLAGGYGYANVNSKAPGSPSDSIHGMNVALYGSYDSIDLCESRNQRIQTKDKEKLLDRDGAWYVDGMFGFAQNYYDSRREIWLTPTAARVAKADHYGQQYSTKMEAGYTFMFEDTADLEITPFASLGYSYLRMNDYKEKGADALNLHVDGEGYHELLQTLGTKLAYPFISKKIGTFVPAVKAAWTFDYIADRFETTASFAGGGPSFETKGAKPAKNGLLLGGELAFLTKGNWTLTGNYDLELKDEYSAHTYYGTVRFDF